MAAKFQKLQSDYEHLLSEYNTMKHKLKCKTEALLILSHEQEQYRSERDQYKLMADQLRERYSALRKRVEGWGPSLIGVYDVRGFKGEREQSLVQLLCELKEQNKTLHYEVNDLTQKLADARGDIKMLREERIRSRSDSFSDDMAYKQFPTYERQTLVTQLEVFRHKSLQLERDLQAIFDEKEELVTARDTYRNKYERLNQQLNCLLRGDQHSFVDIDGVVMENRYLQERIKQVVEEKNMTAAALSKCKALLEKKRSGGGLKLNSIAAGLAVSAKQVEQLLQNNQFLDKVGNSKNSADFRNLVMTLLEALSDKTLALSHQTKTNKILGSRISELEQKIKSMEATSLWKFNDTGRLKYLGNAPPSDDDDEQTVEKISPQHSLGGITKEYDDSLENDMKTSLVSNSSKIDDSPNHVRVESSFSDLDLLPTKECSIMDYRFSGAGSISSSASHVSDSRSCTPFQSPIYRVKNVHSDSDISPSKTMHCAISSASLQAGTVPYTIDRSKLDIDDLPPKLQELLIAALAEVDGPPLEDEDVEASQPDSMKSVVKDDDPSC